MILGEPAQEVGGGRSSRPLWQRLCLPVSVLVNLFLVGLIFGHVAGQPGGISNRSHLSRALAAAEASLSPADAAAFAGAMNRSGPRYQAAEHDLVEARNSLELQITAGQYDPAKVRQALTVWHDSWDRFVDGFGAALIDALGQVSPDGRRRLVKEHERASPGSHKP